MRILMLNYEFPPLGGGASPVSYEIAKGYIELGHGVDVITMGFKELPEFEVKDGINIYRVKCIRSKKEICYPHEMFSFLFPAFLKAYSLHKKNNYDINHTHFIIPTGIISYFLKKFSGLNYIVTTHGSDVLGYNKRFNKFYPVLKPLWKTIVKNANYVITPSKFLQNKIKKITKNCNLKVIPHSIDLNKIKPMEKEKYILLCSRLFINKGVQDFLKAIKDVNLEEWTVKIAGEGPYKKELIKLRDKYNLKEKVDFLDWIDNKSKEYVELFGHASIFVCPSWFESMGITLMEAAAAGDAIITTNTTGCSEVIDDTALLVRPKNSGDICQALLELIKNEKLRKELGSKARKRAKDIFNWKNIMKRYEEVLKNEKN